MWEKVAQTELGKGNLTRCKPVSVPLRATAIPLGPTSLTGSSDLPESRAERAAPPLLFGLAPRGVCPAGRIAPSAVRSYRTISPLPARKPAVYFLLHFPSDLAVRPAVSRHAALWRPDFPPPFAGSDHPNVQPHLIIAFSDLADFVLCRPEFGY